MKTKMEDTLRCVQEQRAGTLNVGMMICKGFKASRFFICHMQIKNLV